MSRVWDALRKSDYLAESKEARSDSNPFSLQIPTETVQVRPESRLVAHTDPRSATADRLRFLRLRFERGLEPGEAQRLLIAARCLTMENPRLHSIWLLPSPRKESAPYC